MTNIDDNSWICPYGKDKLLLVQQILWDMYVLISDIFDKNDIKYYLSYGSMLGALRHKGFIPWDDDLDICVMKDDYDRAISILQRELPSNIVVHNKSNDAIYWLDFTKVRLLNSETFCALWPDDNKFRYKGICLDIYRCWSEQQNKFTHIIKKYKSARQWHLEQLLEPNKKIKKKIRNLLAVICYFSAYMCIKPFEIVCPSKKMIVRDPELMIPPFEDKWLFPLRKVPFNGRLCPIPNNAEGILESQYGDWRQYPDPKHRRVHYTSVKIWDKKYIK